MTDLCTLKIIEIIQIALSLLGISTGTTQTFKLLYLLAELYKIVTVNASALRDLKQNSSAQHGVRIAGARRRIARALQLGWRMQQMLLSYGSALLAEQREDSDRPDLLYT